MRASPVDNGGQGCSKRVMSNQSTNLGEPQIQGDGSLRHPASVGEPGFVYFIRAGRTANVKIGWAKDPYARLEALQCGSPHKLHLIGYFCGSHSDEKALHYTWAAERIRGEWFNLTNPLRSEINSILMQPGATCYLYVATDWRDIRKKRAEIDRLNSRAGKRLASPPAHHNDEEASHG